MKKHERTPKKADVIMTVNSDNWLRDETIQQAGEWATLIGVVVWGVGKLMSFHDTHMGVVKDGDSEGQELTQTIHDNLKPIA